MSKKAGNEKWGLKSVFEGIEKRLVKKGRPDAAIKGLRDLKKRGLRAATAAESRQFEKDFDRLLERDKAVADAFADYMRENLPKLLVKCALVTALIEMQLRALEKSKSAKKANRRKKARSGRKAGSASRTNLRGAKG